MTKLYLTMPQPGETITEGMIVAWIAKPGDEIQEGAPIAELETEKAVFEHESPFVGKILKLLYPAESRVKVGEPIAVMEVPADKAEHYVMLGIGKLAEGETVEPIVASQVATATAVPLPSEIKDLPTAGSSAITREELCSLEQIKMSPYVRRMAFEAGLDKASLMRLAANHPESRITKEAILGVVDPNNPNERRYASVESPHSRRALDVVKPIAPVDPQAEYTIQPFSPVRMRIAENMALSKQKIPHAHTGLTVDVTKAVEFRQANKDAFKKKYGANLNYLSLFFPAMVNAIKKFPSVNASFVENGDKPEIRMFNRINLGVAVGSDYGLIIPVMKAIENKKFAEFNADLNDKITRGMNKKLKPDDYAGPTIIFNNFGFFGTTIGVQIIQYPLAATIGMGVIEKRVIPHHGGIAVRDVADFFIAFDHRILDGREAGLFLSELKKGIENLPLGEIVI